MPGSARRTLVRDGGPIRYGLDEYYGAGAWLLLTDLLALHSLAATSPSAFGSTARGRSQNASPGAACPSGCRYPPPTQPGSASSTLV